MSPAVRWLIELSPSGRSSVREVGRASAQRIDAFPVPVGQCKAIVGIPLTIPARPAFGDARPPSGAHRK